MAVIVGQREWGWEEQVPPNLAGHFRCFLHRPKEPLSEEEYRQAEPPREGAGSEVQESDA